MVVVGLPKCSIRPTPNLIPANVKGTQGYHGSLVGYWLWIGCQREENLRLVWFLGNRGSSLVSNVKESRGMC